VAARKSAEIKTEPKIAEAAEKARALIQELRSRLRLDAVGAIREPPEETQDDLERQLQRYFENAIAKDKHGLSRASILNEIRARVVDGVVERILREWERPKDGTSTPLENEVIERLIDRVIERLSANH
jgi:hypothetical protein